MLLRNPSIYTRTPSAPNSWMARPFKCRLDFTCFSLFLCPQMCVPPNFWVHALLVGYCSSLWINSFIIYCAVHTRVHPYSYLLVLLHRSHVHRGWPGLLTLFKWLPHGICQLGPRGILYLSHALLSFKFKIPSWRRFNAMCRSCFFIFKKMLHSKSTRQFLKQSNHKPPLLRCRPIFKHKIIPSDH